MEKIDNKCSRISEIRRFFCNGNNRKMSNMTGIEETYLSKICKGSAVPGDTIFDKILQTFPDISRSWLVLGEGTMLSTTQPVVNPAPKQADPGTITMPVDVWNLIRSQQDTIRSQQDTIAALSVREKNFDLTTPGSPAPSTQSALIEK